jgi:hypothetical protein
MRVMIVMIVWGCLKSIGAKLKERQMVGGCLGVEVTSWKEEERKVEGH